MIRADQLSPSSTATSEPRSMMAFGLAPSGCSGGHRSVMFGTRAA
jgi:hypothetical protein